MITYRSGSDILTARAEDFRTLLTNRAGAYLALAAPNRSNYDGLYVPIRGAYWKTVWNLLPEGACASMEIGDTVRRVFPEAEQECFLTEDALVMTTGSCTLTLDCKKMYDEREHDRRYEISIKGPHDAGAGRDKLASVTIANVRYACPAGTIHLCIATTMRVSRLDRWRPVEYPYDARRGTRSTPWVYDALRLSGTGRVTIAAGDDPKECEQRAMTSLLHADLPPRSAGPLPLAIASRALMALRTERGILAGFPWFSQVWSRDELIAAGGLLALGEHDAVARILDRWYAAATGGSLPAIYPGEGLRSADAPGWLGRRTLDLLAAGKLTVPRAMKWFPIAERLALAYDVRDGLVWTGTKETWMDTDPGGDGRAGARIEIQALFISLCDAALALARHAGAQPPRAIEERRAAVAAGVRRLVRGDALMDGFHPDGAPDPRQRPNVFLAWYACPDMFSGEEWRVFFERALDSLWLPWGGIASLPPGEGYHPRDTGEDNAAYHHGDSWYFVNNIAALALRHVARDQFADRIRALLAASVRDLCTQGFLGHSSEISSAATQEAMGCHAQAWSASTLVEALHR